MPWHKLKIEGLGRIEREAARFLVCPVRDDLPMGFRIKIVEDQNGLFTGYPEIAIRRPDDGEPDGTTGFGYTIEEALSATVKSFLDTLDGKPPITDDSIWWDPRF